MQHTHLLIIGSGPAGYTAGVYGARAMLAPVLLQGLQPGGQLTITTDVENWPGLVATQGPDLMAAMEAQARHAGVDIHADIATKISPPLHDDECFLVETESGAIWAADAVILATGARAKWLGLPSEQKYQGRGVSACATCDGFFYRGREVVVVGGGNTAVEEALYLANIASKVTLVHRRDSLRAERILVERLMSHPKIDIQWNTTVEEILGDAPGVTGVRLQSAVNGSSFVLPTHGVFVAIGHAPATELVEGIAQLREGGYVWTEPGTPRTSVPGLYAAGDVADPVWRQAVTSAAMGCMAALEAERYVAALEATEGVGASVAAE